METGESKTGSLEDSFRELSRIFDISRSTDEETLSAKLQQAKSLIPTLSKADDFIDKLKYCLNKVERRKSYDLVRYALTHFPRSLTEYVKDKYRYSNSDLFSDYGDFDEAVDNRWNRLIMLETLASCKETEIDQRKVAEWKGQDIVAAKVMFNKEGHVHQMETRQKVAKLALSVITILEENSLYDGKGKDKQILMSVLDAYQASLSKDRVTQEDVSNDVINTQSEEIQKAIYDKIKESLGSKFYVDKDGAASGEAVAASGAVRAVVAASALGSPLRAVTVPTLPQTPAQGVLKFTRRAGVLKKGAKVCVTLGNSNSR